MTKKLFIFDLDGTIVDTIESIRKAINMAMKGYGYPEKSYDEVRCAIGNGARELIRRCLPEEKRGDEAHVTEVLVRYESYYDVTYVHVNGCYSGVREAILGLRKEGNTLAVLSNKQDLYTKKIIDLLFPEQPFAFVQGQTDLPRKPDPTVPRMIIDQLGMSCENVFFVGDSEVDVLTAHNAGMTAVGCAWGYRGEEILRQSGADILLHHGEEIAHL